MTSQLSFFGELNDIFRCAQNLEGVGECVEEGLINYKRKQFPILSFKFGNNNPNVPKLVIIGGIHGLEKIGTHVVTSYLNTMIRLLKWDPGVKSLMEHCQLLFYPLANPVGMYRGSRSNGHGVDLMRNAPIEAKSAVMPIIGGHRISPKIPWYRGYDQNHMEKESEILCQFIEQNTFQANTTVILDVHSGFGLVDRIWFPYAHSRSVFPEAYKVLALKRLLDYSYPQHVYTIEPQNLQYMAHGDLWDYMYYRFRKKNVDQKMTFLPLCLEMGSWHWIRKNPRQLVSPFGIFNPIMPHRLKRIQRRHLTLFDFLLKAVNSEHQWSHLCSGEKNYLTKKAIEQWYKPRSKLSMLG